VRNLGVSTEQWQVAKKQKGGSHENALRKVGQAFRYEITASDARWRFESGKLPKEMQADIPGSGIHVHFGGGLSEGRKLPLFDIPGTELEFSVGLAVPHFQRSGKAHSGVTLAVDLQLPTAGPDITVPLIVSLMHPNLPAREGVASDGRTGFVGTHLGPNTTYIHTVANAQRAGPWPVSERFAFRLTRGNVRRIVADFNERRRLDGGALVDETRLDRARVSSATLRNESTRLTEGQVSLEVVVDYLRIARVPAGRL
jgi:hypothetical protein